MSWISYGDFVEFYGKLLSSYLLIKLVTEC